MPDVTQEMVRAVLDRSSLASSPCAAAVRAPDRSGAEAGSGRLGGSVNVTSDTVMYAASIAKQVVGMLAAQQVVDGLIDPDEMLAHHLDGLPAWAGRVRVRHLVHHTSGLHDEGQSDTLGGNAEAMARLRAVSRLRTEPGSTYRYSNIGYICLAEVLSRTAGRPAENLAADLFARLNMPAARLGGPFPDPLDGQHPPPSTVGDGGLWLSVRDLRSWNDAMNSRVLGGAVHTLAETPGALDDGTRLDYAWGIRVITHAGRRTVSHGGSWPGWSAKAVRQPDSGLSVAILTTSPDVREVTAVALELADQLAGRSS